MDKDEQALTERQQYWLDHIKACEASGKGATAYAAEHGFRVGAMYAGKKSLVKKGVLPVTRRSRFQRVQAEAVSVGSQWHVQLPNGVSVDFSGTVDASSLSTVLSTAARLE